MLLDAATKNHYEMLVISKMDKIETRRKEASYSPIMKCAASPQEFVT
jgi:hypothetical protein